MKIGILAGGHGSRLGMGPKAFVLVNGIPMWQRVLEEFRGVFGNGAEIVIVAPAGTPAIDGVELIVTKGKYLSDLLSVIERKPDLEPMIIVNVDAVLINTDLIRNFIDRVAICKEDFIWPVVHRLFLWPERKSSRVTKYLVGSHNCFAQGNLIYIKGDVKPNLQIILRMNRCKPLADLIALGWGNFLRLMTFQIKPHDIERRLGELLGCRARLLECMWPEIAFDIDTPSDLAFAEQKLRERQVV